MRSKVLPIIAAALVLAALSVRNGAAQAQEAKSALEADSKGWKQITPDAKLDGWVRGPIPVGAELGKEQWHYDPAAKLLVCDGDGGHDWIRYDQEVGDFIYHVEWRFVPMEGKKGYNSGVFVRNSPEGRIWHQAQTGDRSGGFLFGNTFVKGQEMRFNLSGQVKEQRVKPAGEWNTYEVTCRGPKISLWVNGAVTNEWTQCEVPHGYVGLEGEGWKIEFRNLQLKEL